MIPIDLSLALGIYLVFALGWVIVFWLVSEHRRRGQDFTGEQRARWRCGLCLEHYVDSVAEHYSRCPHCGHLNQEKPS